MSGRANSPRIFMIRYATDTSWLPLGPPAEARPTAVEWRWVDALYPFGVVACEILSKVAMLDFLMIAYGVGFFVLSIFYVLACEKM